ncbi:MAG: tRNA-intron lyase, partial [Halobacteria archaeon]|nr:tRNA-intron lyase [Halobacteria archaeon]
MPTYVPQIEGNTVRVGGNARQQFYDPSGYGRPEETGNEITLSFVEAAHLLWRGKFDSIDRMEFDAFVSYASESNDLFIPLLVVYNDLRERGFYIQHLPLDDSIDVYPRGEKPYESEPAYTVKVVTERDTFDSGEMGDVLGVVDDEGDVTYFEVEAWDEQGETPTLDIDTQLVGEVVGSHVVVVDYPDDLHSRAFYGSESSGRLLLSPVEAHYLSERGVLDFEDELPRGDDFDRRARVYADLRDRRTCPRSGFKFGTDFRVYDYETVENLDDVSHSEYLVETVERGHVFDASEVSRAVRLAHGVNKTMVFA